MPSDLSTPYLAAASPWARIGETGNHSPPIGEVHACSVGMLSVLMPRITALCFLNTS
jgi:hypothetical protein